MGLRSRHSWLSQILERRLPFVSIFGADSGLWKIIITRPAGLTRPISVTASKYLRIRMGMVYSTRKRHLLKTFLSVLELSWAWAVSMWECLPS